jgi:hypothetical protein
MKNHILLLTFLHFFAFSSMAQDINTNKPPLNKRQLSWYQRRGIDLHKYDFQNQTYNKLIKTTRRHAFLGSVTLGVGTLTAVSGLVFLLSKPTPCTTTLPGFCKSVENLRYVSGTFQVVISIPLFALTSHQNKRYENKATLLKKIFPTNKE